MTDKPCNPKSALDPCWQALALYRGGKTMAEVAAAMGIEPQRAQEWILAALGTRRSEIEDAEVPKS